MKLNFSLDFLKQNKDTEELFLGVFLKENRGTLFFIEKKGEKLEVFAQEQFAYTNGWDNLIEDVDDALYKLETNTKRSPEKTIFFIYSHLIDDASREIKRPFLHKIKELSKNLELKPLGYIECHEGVIDYLKKRDGIAPTATLIEFDHSYLTVFVYKSGKIIFQETVKRTSEIIDDLIPVFEKVKHIAMVPTRIVLFDSKNLGVEAEKVLSYRWSSELFMQIPKVEIVPEQDLIQSLIVIFSGQVFSPQKEAAPQEEDRSEKAPAATHGFVVGGDVTPKKEVDQTAHHVPQAVESHQSSAPKNITGMLGGYLAKVSDYTSALKSKAMPYFKKMKATPLPILAIAGVALIVLSFFLMEYFFHKAEVTVFMPGEPIKEAITLPVSTDPDANELKLTSETSSTQLTDTTSTTGKKELGEKAKGTVTIFNSSLSEGKTFSEGTTLTSSGGVEFVLDSEVKVASASGDATNPTPSSAKAAVTAKEIGGDGNLPADTKFSIGGESAVVLGKNEAALSGGVERTVQVVAKADSDKLTKAVEARAKAYSEKEIQSKLGKSRKVLSDLNEVDLADSDFSSAVGQEASTLTLKTDAKITYFTYLQDDLFKLFVNKLKDQIKPGFVINKEEIEYDTTRVSRTRAGTNVTFDVTTKQVKAFDRGKMVKDLPGKTMGSLEKVLKEKYGASGVEFVSVHPLPFLKGFLPLFDKNISVKISNL